MEDDNLLRALEQNILSDLTLQGIESISKVYMVSAYTANFILS